MPALKLDLTIEQGSTYSHGWLVTFNGDAIDETWSARGQIREKVAAEDVLHEFEPTVNADGSVVVGVDADVSSAWDWRRGVYDIEVVNPDESIVLRISEGKVSIDPEVTR